MGLFAKKDNISFSQKVSLRKIGLELLDAPPIIMETHAGMGNIFQTIYHKYDGGVAFEKDAGRCELLARQRPSWAVYEADTPVALALGAGSHLSVNFLDVDPYGDSWPTTQAFFGSKRPFADRMILAVNDGLRHSINIKGAWATKTVAPLIEILGNNMWSNYLDACKLLLQNAVHPVGYTILSFEGYYTGNGRKLTHFIAVLEK